MSKEARCKVCGCVLSKSAKFCPNCGAKSNSNFGAGVIIGSLAFSAFLIFAVSSIFSGSPSNDSTRAESSKEDMEKNSLSISGGIATESDGETVNDAPPIPPISTETVLVDDGYIKATYNELFEEDGINGAFYLRILIENKSEQSITIALSDASLNNMQTTIGSGIPMTIQSGKSSQVPFIVFTSNTGISELDQVENLSFRFNVMESEGTDILEETDIVSIDF